MTIAIKSRMESTSHVEPADIAASITDRPSALAAILSALALPPVSKDNPLGQQIFDARAVGDCLTNNGPVAIMLTEMLAGMMQNRSVQGSERGPQGGNISISAKDRASVWVQGQSGDAAELPRYESHKKVWALKVAGLSEFLSDADGSHIMMRPAEKGYAPIRLDRQFIMKHNPQVGGYYVVYNDGYKSFSPATAFEEDYTRI